MNHVERVVFKLYLKLPKRVRHIWHILRLFPATLDVWENGLKEFGTQGFIFFDYVVRACVTGRRNDANKLQLKEKR